MTKNPELNELQKTVSESNNLRLPTQTTEYLIFFYETYLCRKRCSGRIRAPLCSLPESMRRQKKKKEADITYSSLSERKREK